MAGRKKSSTSKNNFVKNAKNSLANFLANTFIKKPKRGRPKKAWHLKLQEDLKKEIKLSKKYYRQEKKLKIKKYSKFLQKIGLKKKAGRPKKKPTHYVRLLSIWHNIALRFDEIYSWSKKHFDYYFHKFLQLVGLRKKRGRPKKKGEVQVALEPVLKSFFEYLKYISKWRSLLSILFTTSILFLAWWVYWFIFADLPSALDLSRKDPVVTTRILDRHGKLLFRIYEDENRTLVPLSSISNHMTNATIAIEDKGFYSHQGFSLKGITRAFIANIKGDKIQQGGSTITQQLVKNRLLSSEKTIRRKMREILLAVVVEGIYSKEEILSMYLNQVAYGGSTYGVEEAAWRYFDKSASDLSLSEASLLAGLPAAPSVYSPFASNPELAYARQEEVLRRMKEDGHITKQEMIDAKNEELIFTADKISIQAPHFVMYVKKILAEKYGEDLLYTGGLEVRTTLDLDIQHEAEKILQEEMAKLGRFKISNGAVLVTNPKTGEILAMVGSKDYFDFANDGQVNVVTRPRQPGSSIKPLTYAIAFENGKSPSTTIDDSPVVYRSAGAPPYAPKNYDGKFHGRVTLREALGSSYNIPAVKSLAEIGISNYIDKAEEAGITTWKDRSRFGLSLTLGGGEVTMLELAQLYGTFANYGGLVKVDPFLEVTDFRGKVYYENDCVFDQEACLQRRVWDPKVAYLISDVLSDNKARTPAFGPQSVLNILGQQVAVKTGTTNGMRDNWTVGYTSDRLVAVWVGNNDNTPMSFVASGITGASPIWNETIRLLLDPENPHQFSIPEDLIKVKICKYTGTLPCTGCPSISEEVFVRGTEPTKACNPEWFKPKEVDEEGNPVPSVSQPAQSFNQFGQPNIQQTDGSIL